MASIIGVETLQHTNGTTAATIDSSGKVTLPNTPVCIDQYRITTSVTSDGIITAWEQVDDAQFSSGGTSMSLSSGVFTFPHTGLYRIFCFANPTQVSGDSSVNMEIAVSSNSGSTYNALALAISGQPNQQSSMSAEAFVNVTDTSTFRAVIKAGSLSGGSVIQGNTDWNRSAVSFMRVADSQ